MTHADKGKYFQKHAGETEVGEDLQQEIRAHAKDNNISCAAAEKISQKLNKTMGDVGVAIDMLNVNINGCQLGLFGYPGKKKLVQAAESVLPDLESAIKAALVSNRLSCRKAWDIAGKLAIKRMEVCAACEKMQIKVKPCQLGAF
jgi:hypothetical protein